MEFLWFYIFIQYISFSLGSFDFDELTNANYGMEILEKPVVMNEEAVADSGVSFQMTSVHGQHYQCSHPVVLTDFKVKEEEQVAMETGVLELLKPMAEGPCLVQTKGWWSYEFCFGREIKQYHMQEGKISGVVTSLGKFGSEFNWDDEEEVREKTKRKLLNRYHSQQYVNGSMCDLTGRTRQTEVRFICEEDHGDYINRIDEPQTCSYLITVHTMKICHHPYLKTPTPKKPVAVTCQPVLSEREFEEYEEEERLEQERREREKKKYSAEQNMKTLKSTREEFLLQDGQLVPVSASKEEGTGSGDPWRDLTDEAAVSESVNQLDKALSAALQKSMQDIFGDQVQQNGQVKMKVQMLDDDTDLPEVIKNYKKQAAAEFRKELGAVTGELEDQDAEDEEDWDDDEEFDDEEEWTTATARDGGNMDTEEEELEDQELLDEFDENLRDIAPKDKDLASFAKHSNRIRDALTDDFDDIIKEAQEELGDEAPEDLDPNEMTRKLAKTLNALLQKLEKAENDLSEADSHLQEALHKQAEEDDAENLQEEEWISEHKPTQKPPSNRQSSRGTFARPLKPSEDKKPSAKVLTDLYKQKASDTSERTPQNVDSSTDDEGSLGEKQVGSGDTNGIVGNGRASDENIASGSDQEQVGRRSESDSTEDESSQKPASHRGDETSSPNKPLEMSSSKAMKHDRGESNSGTDTSLDTAKQGTSQKSGGMEKSSELKTSLVKNDKKLEVKIVHTAYYDEKEGTLHILPEDEGQLSNIMMAVLGDNRDQWKEEERQEQLEKGYNFKFGSGKQQRKDRQKQQKVLL